MMILTCRLPQMALLQTDVYKRQIKARLLLNAEVFIKESHYTECAELCREIISGKYGKSLVDVYKRQV